MFPCIELHKMNFLAEIVRVFVVDPVTFGSHKDLGKLYSYSYEINLVIFKLKE